MVARARIVGADPSIEIQMRYAVAPAIGVHDKVAGEVTVAFSDGEVSVIEPLHVFDEGTVKRNSLECWSGQPAKVVSTYHVNVPSPTRRVRVVPVVVPIRSAVAAVGPMKSL